MDSIARSDLAATYRRMIIRYGRDPHWRKALQRGYDLLDSRAWEWDGRVLTIDSAAPPRRYRVTRDGCECQAAQKGLICKHLGLRLLCTNIPLISTADRQAAVDELV